MPEEKDKTLDSIKQTITALQAKVKAELDLASAAGKSTAAQRLQTAAGEADQTVSKLQAQAESLRRLVTTGMGPIAAPER